MVKPAISTATLAQGLQNGDRAALGQAITLIESNAAQHTHAAQSLLGELLPLTGNSIRIGVTGIPGAGKSTFIEALGVRLCDAGLHVAVLAVDPSSAVSGGSILGDKTRMDTLSQHPHSFVRPSPSGGTPGGVNRKSREAMLLCEAAGYNVIIVETVGVGQSEACVRGMVDFFLLLTLANTGDELQGFKRGVMELADAIAVNKADGDNTIASERTCQELNTVLQYLMPPTSGWATRAMPCSALTKTGIAEIWSTIESFRESTTSSGVLQTRRNAQLGEWMEALVSERLKSEFYDNPQINAERCALKKEVIQGQLPVTTAADKLFSIYMKTKNNDHS